MKRVATQWRPNWQATVESQGLPFHTNGQRPGGDVGTYWFEGAYYELSAADVDCLESATSELHRICLLAVDRLAHDPKTTARMGIPSAYQELAAQSWSRGDPTIYGRFDLAWDGNSSPKLLEYNADTPTALIETSIVQWFWLQDTRPDADQFNSLHEKLIDQWRAIRSMIGERVLYFSSIKNNLEEFATVEYLRDVATQAGVITQFLHVEDIGFDGTRFVDLDGRPLEFWFKLYPWEWLWREEFGRYLPSLSDRLGILEPPWKMLLSNKGILPVLWEMFPSHANLLPAFWDSAPLKDRWIAKPTLGREGRNIVVRKGSSERVTEGPYQAEPKIYQAFAELPRFGNHYAVLGSWLVGDKPAGICIREDENEIITNGSALVPHAMALTSAEGEK